MAKKPTQIGSFVRTMVAASGKDRSWLWLAVATVIVTAAVNVGFSHKLRSLTDAAVSLDPRGFWAALVAVAILAFAEIVLAYCKTRFCGTFGEKTLARLRGLLAGQVSVLPARHVENAHTGDLLSVMNNDLMKMKTVVSTDLVEIAGQTVLAVASLVYLLILNWQLAVVSTVLTPALFWGVSILTKPLTRHTAAMQEAIGGVNSVAQDGLSGLAVVKAFNLQETLTRRFVAENRKAVGRGRVIARLGAGVTGVSMAAQILPFLIVFGYGGYLVIAGQLTVGGITAFINLMNNLANPLAVLPRHFASLGEGAGAMERVRVVLDHPAEQNSGSQASPNPEAPWALSLNRVCFEYDPGIPAIKDMTLHIGRGEKVALVGSSGCGKSTLLKLILGLYPAARGELEVLGHREEDWDLGALRSQIALVAQETYLFPASIAENISLGRPGACREDIEEAARLANIHDVICSLPEGYDTLVGERGARLSGGERQRVAIARALLKNAPLLLLDEATSALDNESEFLVQEALERAMEGRTTLMVAHRFSTIRNADRIIVLDGGEIIEQGTHDALMATQGPYYRLFMRQFEPNGPEDPEEGGARIA